ncbi:MAG TPA: CoA transferase [Gammaproteobacteria bacterium]|jgi:crotonobetainyl-CoA:carnitine CoA-transferase CaiB-like acyl-CoA transferase|nr:CoA transferase [Gammaproteobacteria bacterium]HIK71804.1 CoA transferase [Gammaproteobacteria bacterium]
MSGPLEGYKVLELTSTVSGPFASMMLADQGAEVTKVEPPGIGDLARFMGTTKTGIGAMFTVLNRNKKCICLDFKNPEDFEVLTKLIQETDVLVENYRPGIVKKLGIDYDSAVKINPEIIYCSISGYGQSGPYKERKVYDPLIQATAGTAAAQSSSDPEFFRTIVFDKVTALTAAQTITSALLQKERIGKGQYIPISMMDSALYYSWPDMMMNQTFLEGGESIGELADYFSVYKTKDGFITIILAASDEVFNPFCEYFNADLHKDKKFSNAAARVKNKDDLTSEINKITQEYNTKELIDLMDLHGIPASVVNQLDDIYKDPQVIEQGSLVEVEHPITGTMRMPRPPFKFLNQDKFPKKQATILGADTREVLESLGVENEHILRIEDREEQNRKLLASFNLDQVK